MIRIAHFPWQDPSGRFSAFKLLVFLSLFIPALWVAGRWANHTLGARPLVEALHQMGLWAIRFLLLSLLISPARTLLRMPRLMQVRRMTGVAAFFYAFLHVLLYMADQRFIPGKILHEIAFNVYITIGFIGFLVLLALAATSSNAAIRALGRMRWQQLHYATYVIGLLAVVHFLLQSKLDITEAALMAGFLIWLMLFRVMRRYALPLHNLALLLALAGISAILTALAEAGWYAAKTGVMVQRVLIANLSIHAGLRPAVWVLCIAGLCAIVGALRARTKSRPTGATG